MEVMICSQVMLEVYNYNVQTKNTFLRLLFNFVLALNFEMRITCVPKESCPPLIPEVSC